MTQNSIDPPVILITGSTSGFGRLTAELLASEGYRVFATMREIDGRNAEPARELEAQSIQNGTTLEVIELDVTSEESIERAVAGILESAGRIDVVINNAGIGSGGLLECFTLDQVQTMFDVNTFGPLRVNRAVLPSMRKRQSGLLIHISSAAGRLYFPTLGIYNATKYATEAISECYAEELRSFQIDSICIEPGAFPTDVGANAVVAADSDRVQDYGETALLPHKIGEGFGRIFSGPNAPDPMDVPRSILDLIRTDPGKRPLRVVVGDYATHGIEELNRHTERIQREFAHSLKEQFGLS